MCPAKGRRLHAGRSGRRVASKFVLGVHRIRGIHKRRSATHVHRHCQGFHHLFARRTKPDQGFGVKTDASVAMARHADRERDQLLLDAGQSPGFSASSRTDLLATGPISPLRWQVGSGDVALQLGIRQFHCMPVEKRAFARTALRAFMQALLRHAINGRTLRAHNSHLFQGRVHGHRISVQRV